MIHCILTLYISSGVFYCGEPVLVPQLRQLSADFTHKTNTRFDFHKENF